MFREIVAVAAATFAITAGAASAELATWDQKRVAKYAEELTVATEDLKRALETVGVQNFAQQNAMYQVKDTVKMLDTAASGLAEALKAGKGHDETLPRFKRVDTLRRDAEREGRSADIRDDVFEKVISVGSALLKLRPYYLDEPMPEEKQAE
jgi:hypothetical protein